MVIKSTTSVVSNTEVDNKGRIYKSQKQRDFEYYMRLKFYPAKLYRAEKLKSLTKEKLENAKRSKIDGVPFNDLPRDKYHRIIREIENDAENEIEHSFPKLISNFEMYLPHEYVCQLLDQVLAENKSPTEAYKSLLTLEIRMLLTPYNIYRLLKLQLFHRLFEKEEIDILVARGLLSWSPGVCKVPSKDDDWYFGEIDDTEESLIMNNHSELRELVNIRADKNEISYQELDELIYPNGKGRKQIAKKLVLKKFIGSAKGNEYKGNRFNHAEPENMFMILSNLIDLKLLKNLNNYRELKNKGDLDGLDKFNEHLNKKGRVEVDYLVELEELDKLDYIKEPSLKSAVKFLYDHGVWKRYLISSYSIGTISEVLQKLHLMLNHCLLIVSEKSALSTSKKLTKKVIGLEERVKALQLSAKSDKGELKEFVIGLVDTGMRPKDIIKRASDKFGTPKSTVESIRRRYLEKHS